MSVSHGMIVCMGFPCLCGVCEGPGLASGILKCTPFHFKAKFLTDGVGHLSEAG